jgi:putative peptidoglycan lipid II flippase
VLMRTSLNYGGLALANGLAALVEGAVLMLLIGRRLQGLDLRSVGLSLGRTITASVLMGIVIATLPRLIEERLALTRTMELSAVVAIVVVSGAVLYLTISHLLRSEELRVLLRLARLRG